MPVPRDLIAVVALSILAVCCAPAPEPPPSAPAEPPTPSPSSAPPRADASLEPLFQQSLQEGARLLRERQFEAASLELSKAVGIHPDHAVALRMLGAAYAQANDLNRARRVLEASIEADPMVAGTHYELAQVALALGDFELARRESERTVLLDPDNPKAHEAVGMTLYRQGDVDGAIRTLEPIVKTDPSRIGSAHFLALAYEKHERYAEARDLLRAVVRHSPENAEAWFTLGKVLAALGDESAAAAAQATFQQLRAATPDPVDRSLP